MARQKKSLEGIDLQAMIQKALTEALEKASVKASGAPAHAAMPEQASNSTSALEAEVRRIFSGLRGEIESGVSKAGRPKVEAVIVTPAGVTMFVTAVHTDRRKIASFKGEKL